MTMGRPPGRRNQPGRTISNRGRAARTARAIGDDWRGPHSEYSEALEAAKRRADFSQAAVAVSSLAGRDGWLLGFAREELHREETVHQIVTPNPRRAPFGRWPVVAMAATTDQATRDVQAECWRDYSARLAASVGITGAIRPLVVHISQKFTKISFAKLPLYVYVVRRNPNFPSDFDLPLMAGMFNDRNPAPQPPPLPDAQTTDHDH
jgi:hypothetical protein